MIVAYALIAVALVVAGALLGSLMIVVVGIHREERASSLANTSPGRAASGARAIHGVRRPGVPQRASQHQQDSWH
jgi:hypothetical protein